MFGSERCADARSGWSLLSVGPPSIACTSERRTERVHAHRGRSICRRSVSSRRSGRCRRPSWSSTTRGAGPPGPAPRRSGRPSRARRQRLGRSPGSGRGCRRHSGSEGPVPSRSRAAFAPSTVALRRMCALPSPTRCRSASERADAARRGEGSWEPGTDRYGAGWWRWGSAPSAWWDRAAWLRQRPVADPCGHRRSLNLRGGPPTATRPGRRGRGRRARRARRRCPRGLGSSIRGPDGQPGSGACARRSPGQAPASPEAVVVAPAANWCEKRRQGQRSRSAGSLVPLPTCYRSATAGAHRGHRAAMAFTTRSTGLRRKERSGCDLLRSTEHSEPARQEHACSRGSTPHQLRRPNRPRQPASVRRFRRWRRGLSTSRYSPVDPNRARSGS